MARLSAAQQNLVAEITAMCGHDWFSDCSFNGRVARTLGILVERGVLETRSAKVDRYTKRFYRLTGRPDQDYQSLIKAYLKGTHRPHIDSRPVEAWMRILHGRRGPLCSVAPSFTEAIETAITRLTTPEQDELLAQRWGL